MPADVFATFINIVGVVVGIIFVAFAIKNGRALTNVLPRNYTNWMITGSVIFAIGFITDLVGLFVENLPIIDVIHHLSLIVAGVIFIITSINLTDELRPKSQPTQ